MNPTEQAQTTLPPETSTRDRRLLTYAEVAEEYGFNVNTLYALVRLRRIPFKNLGPRFIRFSRAELDTWVASKTSPALMRTEDR